MIRYRQILTKASYAASGLALLCLAFFGYIGFNIGDGTGDISGAKGMKWYFLALSIASIAVVFLIILKAFTTKLNHYYLYIAILIWAATLLPVVIYYLQHP